VTERVTDRDLARPDRAQAVLGGRYRLRARLAAGGMGAVWVADDAVLGREVAVKVLGEALAGDGLAAERLRREARAAARLGHPGVARVLDLGEDGGRPYLVMELLHGESLAERLARAGPLAPAEAVRVVAAAADALEAAHQAGIVHRDVKPGNVFLTRDGEVKLLDFGIASASNEAALTGGGLVGTAAYLAPERALGHDATPAADLYALGVLLYELLAGRPPFAADSQMALAMAHVHGRPVPLREAAPAVPPALAAACEQALAKDPAARPPSAANFAARLRSSLTGPPTLTLPPPAAASPDAAPTATLPPPAAGAGLPALAAASPTSPTDRLPRTMSEAPPSFGAPPAKPTERPPAVATARRRGRPARRGRLGALLAAGLVLAALVAAGPSLGGLLLGGRGVGALIGRPPAGERAPGNLQAPGGAQAPSDGRAAGGETPAGDGQAAGGGQAPGVGAQAPDGQVPGGGQAAGGGGAAGDPPAAPGLGELPRGDPGGQDDGGRSGGEDGGDGESGGEGSSGPG
jgi:serine/threonine protein kinase